MKATAATRARWAALSRAVRQLERLTMGLIALDSASWSSIATGAMIDREILALQEEIDRQITAITVAQLQQDLERKIRREQRKRA